MMKGFNSCNSKKFFSKVVDASREPVVKEGGQEMGHFITFLQIVYLCVAIFCLFSLLRKNWRKVFNGSMITALLMICIIILRLICGNYQVLFFCNDVVNAFVWAYIVSVAEKEME